MSTCSVNVYWAHPLSRLCNSCWEPRKCLLSWNPSTWVGRDRNTYIDNENVIVKFYRRCDGNPKDKQLM